MHQHSSGSCVTALASPSPLFVSSVTWPRDTDQKIERSREKLADFLARQGCSLRAFGWVSTGEGHEFYLTETHFLAVFILSRKGRAQQQQNLK